MSFDDNSEAADRERSGLVTVAEGTAAVLLLVPGAADEFVAADADVCKAEAVDGAVLVDDNAVVSMLPSLVCPNATRGDTTCLRNDTYGNTMTAHSVRELTWR